MEGCAVNLTSCRISHDVHRMLVQYSIFVVTALSRTIPARGDAEPIASGPSSPLAQRPRSGMLCHAPWRVYQLRVD